MRLLFLETPTRLMQAAHARIVSPEGEALPGWWSRDLNFKIPKIFGELEARCERLLQKRTHILASRCSCGGGAAAGPAAPGSNRHWDCARGRRAPCRGGEPG